MYTAVEDDEIDQEMARFLNEDILGTKVTIPVIRLSNGLYLIGLLKYSLEMAPDDSYDDEEDEEYGGED